MDVPLECILKKRSKRPPVDPAVAARAAAYERLKEPICWVMRQGLVHRTVRLSIATINSGTFIELRQYYVRPDGGFAPSRRGILLRVEEASKILPDLIGLVRRMESDQRPEDRSAVEIYYPNATPTTPS